MRTLELFSGYGTVSFALKALGIKLEIIGYSDIDPYANQCFWQNHWKEVLPLRYGRELGDVTKINPHKLEDFELLTAGFPCQSFSVAGKGLGELDTRGTLFNEIIRIAEVKQPRYMLLENVKGLTNKKHRATFEKILSLVEELYRNEVLEALAKQFEKHREWLRRRFMKTMFTPLERFKLWFWGIKI